MLQIIVWPILSRRLDRVYLINDNSFTVRKQYTNCVWHCTGGADAPEASHVSLYLSPAVIFLCNHHQSIHACCTASFCTQSDFPFDITILRLSRLEYGVRGPAVPAIEPVPPVVIHAQQPPGPPHKDQLAGEATNSLPNIIRAESEPRISHCRRRGTPRTLLHH